jgi:hypothetical protein
MLTVEQAREYLQAAIARMIQQLTDTLKVLKVEDEQEIAKEIALAKCDVSDAGNRREQNEGRAEAAHFRCLRGFYALQNVRRKFGDPEHAATSPVEDCQTASAAGTAAAAEAPGQIGPTVTEVPGAARASSEGAAQSDRTGNTQPDVSPALTEAILAECPRQVVYHPLRE